ncbi:DUF1684 domain-containing protein [Ferrimonas lipolytica]|uniref:DUF1684 domain-containing protein n=1 Tax=Ferrimonas lipolytica TaxID=2724191 RepID=A0A6H1UHI5_9GAMM|nr:DUF1684 domain-containing protein [Ferrimonas lipolytica]QIZ78575.1 DUF1684 domain-containing protein [Ferrimonas lipolytica]
MMRVAGIVASVLLLGGCLGGLSESQQQDKQQWLDWRADNDQHARDPHKSFLNIRDAKYLAVGESTWLQSQQSPEEIRWRDKMVGLDFGLTHSGDHAEIVWNHSSHTLNPGGELALSERLSVTVGELYQGGMRAFIRDNQHPKVASFDGYDFFPYNPDAKVDANFTAATPEAVMFQTVQGLKNRFYRIGQVSFKWQGTQVSMPAYHSEAEPPYQSLMLFFKDQTNGEQTYGGGRELYVEVPQGLDKPFALDFNYSGNFYCARSTFWNCPILRDPTLTVAITAGETYEKHQ